MKKKGKKNISRWNYIWISAIIIIAAILVALGDKKTFITKTANLTTLIGATISLIALIITLFEILHISSISSKTQEIVEETKEKIKTIQSITEITSVVLNLEAAQDDIRSSNFQIARFRLQNIQRSLYDIYDLEELEQKNSSARMDITYIETAIIQISHLKLGAELPPEKRKKINTDLQKIASKLLLINKKKNRKLI